MIKYLTVMSLPGFGKFLEYQLFKHLRFLVMTTLTCLYKEVWRNITAIHYQLRELSDKITYSSDVFAWVW